MDEAGGIATRNMNISEPGDVIVTLPEFLTDENPHVYPDGTLANGMMLRVGMGSIVSCACQMGVHAPMLSMGHALPNAMAHLYITSSCVWASIF